MRRRVEDLHGFDTGTAVRFAIARVSEAYANGYDEVEFQHGAGDVQAPPAGGRGKIKWALRELLASGDLDRWCSRADCWPKAASLVVAIKRNPRPRSEFWSPPPYRAVPR